MKLKFGPMRDVVLLVLGVFLLGHETMIVDDPRWPLLLVSTGMMGIPAALGADNLFTRGSGGFSSPQEPSSTDSPSQPSGSQ